MYLGTLAAPREGDTAGETTYPQRSPRSLPADFSNVGKSSIAGFTVGSDRSILRCREIQHRPPHRSLTCGNAWRLAVAPRLRCAEFPLSEFPTVELPTAHDGAGPHNGAIGADDLNWHRPQ